MKTSTTTKLTEAYVVKATPCDAPQLLIWDTTTPGLGVRVGKTAKTFIFQGRMPTGERPRVTIGPVGTWTLKKARQRAQELVVELSKGNNPNKISRQQEAETITLKKAWGDHQKVLKKKKASPLTLKNYEYWMTYLSDWMSTPLAEITPRMVHDRHIKMHDKIAAKRKGDENAGNYLANSMLRLFSAVYNTARSLNPELPENPAKGIKRYPEPTRSELGKQTQKSETAKGAIPANLLSTWWEDVHKLVNPIQRDALLFILFTGLRRTNALEMQWEHVDFEARTVFIPKTKAKRSFTLPLSDFLVEILHRRKAENPKLYRRSPFVFPGPGKTGHIAKLKPKKKDWCRVPFMVHGLRHTYASNGVTVVPNPYMMKSLMDHRADQNDMTGLYTTYGIEDMRAPQQAITDRLMQLCCPTPESDKVMPIKQRKQA